MKSWHCSRRRYKQIDKGQTSGNDRRATGYLQESEQNEKTVSEQNKF